MLSGAQNPATAEASETFHASRPYATIDAARDCAWPGEEAVSMKTTRIVAAVVLAMVIATLAVAGTGEEVEKKPLPELAPELQTELTDYLKQNWQSPEAYVVSKFEHHDIVFLGEYHRIKHDVQLVHNLIPRLYAAGIYNLGIEFGAEEMQQKVDQLLAAPAYDEKLAREIMFESLPFWGYTDYMDIYRAAWKLNNSLPSSARKFRVVNLNYIPRFELVKEEMTPEDWAQVWYRGDDDEVMAGVILREFVDEKEKALIYSGNHHAFTRYRQPLYDFQQQKLHGLKDNRMGNLVYAKIGDRAFNIYLHSSWWSKKDTDYQASGYPVGGVIDRVMREFADTRVGFDVRGTPFGELPDEIAYYALGYEDFTLADYCDGYIYQRHFPDYEGVTPDPQFITQENLARALAAIPNLEARKRVTEAAQLLEVIARDADMSRRFPHLH